MAEGILKSLYSDRYEVFSAGTDPTNENPFAIEVMEEIEINISKNHSKSLKEFPGIEFDFVLTVCDTAKESCPFFPGWKRFIHKGFEDLSRVEGTDDDIIQAFRKVRNEIKNWIEETFGGEGEIFNDYRLFKGKI